jgi:hypothetical protein
MGKGKVIWGTGNQAISESNEIARFSKAGGWDCPQRQPGCPAVLPWQPGWWGGYKTRKPRCGILQRGFC